MTTIRPPNVPWLTIEMRTAVEWGNRFPFDPEERTTEDDFEFSATVEDEINRVFDIDN